MKQKDYSRRPVVDKLGLKPGAGVAVAAYGSSHEAALVADVVRAIGRPLLDDGESADVVLLAVADGDGVADILRAWRPRIQPSGVLWVMTPKRGRPGYIPQNQLITAGANAALVDNKICAISDTTSAMRFVIRLRDRPAVAGAPSSA